MNAWKIQHPRTLPQNVCLPFWFWLASTWIHARYLYSMPGQDNIIYYTVICEYSYGHIRQLMASVRSATFFGIQSPPFPFSISHCFTVTVNSNLWFWIWTYPEVLWIAALKWVFWNDTMTICLSHAKLVYRKTPPNVALFEAFQSSFCGESFWAMKILVNFHHPQHMLGNHATFKNHFPIFPLFPTKLPFEQVVLTTLLQILRLELPNFYFGCLPSSTCVLRFEAGDLT